MAHSVPAPHHDPDNWQKVDGNVPFLCRHACPPTVANVEQTVTWISQNRATLLEESFRYGAVLLRGFPVRSAEDFDRVVTAFQLENFPYYQSLSNAVRINYTPRVFSANEAPPEVRILLHHEMAQTPIYPEKLFFFCQTPATEGGATPLCPSVTLWERIRGTFPEFADGCRKLGLRYSHVMPAEDDPSSGMGRSWRSTLRVDTAAEAEARLQELGYSWQWLSEGCLRVTTPTLPAVLDVDAQRTSFFNQLIAAYQGWRDSRNDPSRAITFGDGTPLDAQVVSQIAQMAEQLVYDHAWQQGDVVLLDNRVVMHGRRTFRGQRRVLASLAEPRRQSFVPQ